MSKGIRLAAGLAGLALLVSACGEAPDESKEGTAEGPLACMVTDTGGIDDRSFNAAAWVGMQAGAKATSGKAEYVASTNENDYIPNINELVNKGCDTIVTVGGLMGDATTEAAKAHPDQQFAIVDSPSVAGQKIYGMEFNTAQSSFQAGYLAASMSKSGKVATYGGLAIPPVTIFMDGFYEGVQYFNEKKGKKVEVLGWDPAKPDSGSIAGAFGDLAKGKSIAKGFIEQGADIIFPVAGGTGLGSAAAAKESGGKVSVIWVDTDGCESAADYCDVFLTSVMKNVNGAVEQAVTKAGSGELTGSYLGTLENGGTSLAPFHEFDSKVPADLKTELDQIKTDIASGTISIKSVSQPKG
ncbi:BMP family ABC transporter substrate-binding protein [Actinocorallia sp. A-T 12471]|uniref:BMP family lipoprotein n=1 Tax=Actinocorallia sp. A-T 12471 TaxID=3089813 RepID=UPI0029CD1698|nr:BMP family ABC transporter substrate-binding protein [Actinocorallia sp. A-T 12471]MDX6744511.1 BMP family ABC transporter substrate-binding protein [Actinocorallia sp. A-T 12471]